MPPFASFMPKDDTDTRARIGLLERMLIDICACSDVTLPRSIREKIGDLVDLSAEHDVGHFLVPVLPVRIEPASAHCDAPYSAVRN
jgi:hypothetical protein